MASSTSGCAESRPPARRTLRVGLAQLDYTIGDLEGNFAQIRDHIRQGRQQGAELVVFSECALLGYPPRDLVDRDDLIDRQLDILERVAGLTDDRLAVVVGFIAPNPDPTGKPLRNAAAVCRGGEVVATAVKRLLPSYDVFDEQRYFEAGHAATVVEIGGVKLGISICEDAWNQRDFWQRPTYECDPIEELGAAGAEALINLAASPFHLDKGDFRRRLISSHASALGCPMVFVNQVGGHDELIFDGRSLVVSADGDLSARLDEFRPDFAVHDLHVPGPPPPSGRSCAPSCDDPADQAIEAVVLGVRDYFHKTGFDSAVLGLSGGIDSSLTAALAARALGADRVLGVAMPSRYTHDISNDDACLLADNLGIDFMSIPIEQTFAGFVEQLEVPFDGRQDDVTEENLQARIRGVTLMALSNKLGHLVLVPSNKSELAVGYSTLYGDLVGALCPLGDCLKTLVYQMARRVNQQTGRETIPARTIERPPSAELRHDQTDQDELPAYEVLDPILAAYIHDGLSAAQIVDRGFDAAVVDDVLARVFRAEYKRWQTAPILKITSNAFGLGWRYPLAADYRALRN